MNNSDLVKELSTNFIEYAAAVNSDRAIPDARDGLKPVAKRILYGTYYSGYTSNKPFVKCARIVGDIMGLWHPHGDTSIYEALVRLAQPWSLRYPLMDFHGNMGNQGGDGPAAYRYTEARTSKLTEDGLLYGIKKKNVEFVPNYDDKDEEPSVLPAIFPNLLCNPNSGIGVSLACNWASHNLKEVADAIYDYMDGKEPMLPGPDFPSGGIVINKDDIPSIMATGRGSVKLRGKYKVEKQNIVFYEIPYGTTIEGILSEIGELCDKEEIDSVVDVRNESDKKGLRIVIECQKGINPESIITKLFAKTDLQTSFSYNQVALINKTPVELNLKDCIRIYVEHNVDCLLKEINEDIVKAKERQEVIEGLIKAIADIDEIIKLIKHSDNASDAKDKLMRTYNFTELQAKSILAMKLSSLAKLEGIELEKELNELLNNIKEWNIIISSKDKQIEIIRSRLKTIVTKYGDARRTELVQINTLKEEKEVAQITPENCIVKMLQNGEIKRIPANSHKAQTRNGKGVKTTDDAILNIISTNTIDTLMLFSNKGKMYRILVDNVPVGTNASKGVNISTLIKMDMDEKIIAVTSLERKSDPKYIVFTTRNGLLKKSKLSEYKETKRNNGIIAIGLKDGDSLVSVNFMDEQEFVMVSRNGLAIQFETNKIAAIGRATAGVKAMKLDDGDYVIAGFPISGNETIGVFTSNGMGKKTAVKELPIQQRNGKGLKISTDQLIGTFPINDGDNVLITGKPNSICFSASELPLLSRTSLGNALIKNSVALAATRIQKEG